MIEMNLRFYIICTASLLALGVTIIPTLGVPFLAGSNITATVHGATYSWDTFEPLNDTLISINSNPLQSIVAKDGTYSFELAPGNYIITARYYQNNTLVYSKEASLNIESEGSYVFDLLLYPVSVNPVTEIIPDEINDLNSANPTEQTRPEFSAVRYLPVAFTLFILLGGGYKLSRKYEKMNKNRFQEGKFNTSGILKKVVGEGVISEVGSEFGNIEKVTSVTESIIESADNSEIEIAASRKLPLSADLREVLDIIRGHKGKITQKDLRSKLEYSEVKVSLLLSELEKRGLIRKLKNGRENILVLIDENR